MCKDPPPAAGQVPEQEVEAKIDAGLVHDRHVDRELARAQDRAAEQAAGHLRKTGQLPHEPLVEHSDAG